MIWITSPYLRHNIFSTFEELSNKERQLKEWIGGAVHGYWDNLCYYIFNDLYDEGLEIPMGARQSLIRILYTREEVNEVYNFACFLDNLTEEIGDLQPDYAYINHPQWSKVWRWSKNIYDMMGKNNKKYNFYEECYEKFNNMDFHEYGTYVERKNAEAGNEMIPYEKPIIYKRSELDKNLNNLITDVFA
ncbi:MULTISPECIES: SCO4402 family protein [unclassified Candidatus Tisiphia]